MIFRYDKNFSILVKHVNFLFVEVRCEIINFKGKINNIDKSLMMFGGKQMAKDDEMNKLSSRERIIALFLRMFKGETITYTEAMADYNASQRPVQMDIQFIRTALKEYMPESELFYDKGKGVHGIKSKGKFQSGELLAILKILIGTRAFGKQELMDIEYDLLELISTDDRSQVKRLLGAANDAYIPVAQRDDLIELIGNFFDWIINKKPIEYDYKSSNGRGPQNGHVGIPFNLYFDRFYFYVRMYVIDLNKSYVCRVDRFTMCKPKSRSYNIPEIKKEDVNAAINKTYLLKMGNEIHFKIQYWSYPQTALDALPGSKVEKILDDGSVIITGDIFLRGILLWALGQGDGVKVLAPQSLVDAVVERLRKTMTLYE